MAQSFSRSLPSALSSREHTSSLATVSGCLGSILHLTAKLDVCQPDLDKTLPIDATGHTGIMHNLERKQKEGPASNFHHASSPVSSADAPAVTHSEQSPADYGSKFLSDRQVAMECNKLDQAASKPNSNKKEQYMSHHDSDRKSERTSEATSPGSLHPDIMCTRDYNGKGEAMLGGAPAMQWRHVCMVPYSSTKPSMSSASVGRGVNRAQCKPYVCRDAFNDAHGVGGLNDRVDIHQPKHI